MKLSTFFFGSPHMESDRFVQLFSLEPVYGPASGPVPQVNPLYLRGLFIS